MSSTIQIFPGGDQSTVSDDGNLFLHFGSESPLVGDVFVAIVQCWGTEVPINNWFGSPKHTFNHGTHRTYVYSRKVDENPSGLTEEHRFEIPVPRIMQGLLFVVRGSVNNAMGPYGIASIVGDYVDEIPPVDLDDTEGLVVESVYVVSAMSSVYPEDPRAGIVGDDVVGVASVGFANLTNGGGSLKVYRGPWNGPAGVTVEGHESGFVLNMGFTYLDESDEPDPEEPSEECCSHKEIVIRIKVKDICGVEVTSD